MNANILYVPVLLPLAAAILIFVLPRKVPWVREMLSLLTSAATFAAALRIFLVPPQAVRIPLVEISAFSLSFDLVVTPLSSFILIFAAGFGALISLYSISYMAGKQRGKQYYAFFLIALAGSCGVLLADHLLLLLIFWEMVSASLYFLVASGGAEAKAGATKTFAMLGAGDGSLLLGIGLLWYAARSFSISSISVPVQGWLASAAFVFMLLGSIAKAGAMPLHSWIPSASEGSPASVMAFLPAAVDKLLGIYLLARMVTGLFTLNYGMGLLLMIIGAVTILAAVMVAMVQHDLRRLLSYHAVSQVGYMLLGIGTLTPIGIAGGLFHMLNNSLFKNCLFLACGAVEKKAGTTDLAKLGGLGRAMPVTFTTCLIAALAISGVPPLNGFVSKWFVYQGVIETGMRSSFIFLVAAMFGSALTLASFIKVLYSLFLGQKTAETAEVRSETGFAMWLPMVVLATACVFFGVYYTFPVNAFIYPGAGVRVTIPGIWSSTLATGLIVVGLIVGLIIYLAGRVMKSARVVPSFTGGEHLDSKTGRVLGTHFYDTIRSIPILSRIYNAQEKGRLDPYVWFGGLGLAFTGLLRRIHNGLLSWYLSWSLAGIVILVVLFAFIL